MRPSRLVPAGARLMNVVVETPAGSRNKYKFDEKLTEKIRPVARSLSDLPAGVVDQIEHFFVAYNRFEGREFVPRRRRGPEAAEARVERAVADHARRGEQGE